MPVNRQQKSELSMLRVVNFFKKTVGSDFYAADCNSTWVLLSISERNTELLVRWGRSECKLSQLIGGWWKRWGNGKDWGSRTVSWYFLFLTSVCIFFFWLKIQRKQVYRLVPSPLLTFSLHNSHKMIAA